MILTALALAVAPPAVPCRAPRPQTTSAASESAAQAPTEVRHPPNSCSIGGVNAAPIPPPAASAAV